MKTYDRPHKILERKRGVFFRIGLMTSLLITFLAFEWKTAIPRTIIEKEPFEWDTIDIELPPVTWQKEEVSLPAPKLPVKSISPEIITTDLIIVPDNISVDALPVDSFVMADIIPIEVKPEPEIEDFVYAAEISPEFPGKDKGLQKYLKNNLRYPEDARIEGLNGTVYVIFIIDEKGNVVNIECERSPSPILTAEAIRVVKQMPRWKPGIQGGKPVRVKMAVPVTFKLL